MEWIDALSPSAAQFFGAVIGVGGGLVAILTGALVNAALNRSRDNRLQNQEGRAVAAGLKGELASIRLSIISLVPVWEEGEREFGNVISCLSHEFSGSGKVDASAYAKLPPSHIPIFEANASRLGLLGANLAGAVSVLYTNYRVRAVVFEESLEIKATDLPKHFAEQIRWANQFCNDCKDLEHLLTNFEETGRSVMPAEIWRGKVKSR